MTKEAARKVSKENKGLVAWTRDRDYAPQYTLAEELVNSISHGVGAALAIAALVLCVVKADTPGAEVGAALYGAFMIILYAISCIYHALGRGLKGKEVLRVIDHANVFLMEAGTYMPICLGLFGGGALGWTTFGIVWAVTITAVVLSSIDVNRFWIAGVACNLILGWGSLLLLGPLAELTGAGVWWLIGGGLAYTVGAVLYAIGSRRKWFHSIFHFFVLLGSVLHFFFIFLYCCP